MRVILSKIIVLMIAKKKIKIKLSWLQKNNYRTRFDIFKIVFDCAFIYYYDTKHTIVAVYIAAVQIVKSAILTVYDYTK